MKKEQDVLLLVHNYQRSEIQDLADKLGDSYDLSRSATEAKASTIVFCGVRFMAESAKILCPEKRVLLPEKEASCPLADMISAEQVRELKRLHPEAIVICYINTYAEVKAESDICCTSANALKIISRFPDREIIYIPDQNMAAYAQQVLKRDIIIWPGYCYVHHRLLSSAQVRQARRANPGALVLAHPECPLDVLGEADLVVGTSGMIRHVGESDRKSIIVVTETGLVERMRREFPDKVFIAIDSALCVQMKLTRLESLYESLKFGREEIVLSEDIMRRARRSLERMLEFS